MHSSKSILHSACLIKRCCLTAGRGYCISLAAHMMRKTIWVTDEHLNLSGSVSAAPQSDGHPDLNPLFFMCTAVKWILSAHPQSDICLFVQEGHCIRPLILLHCTSMLTIDNSWGSPHHSQALHSFQYLIYNFRGLLLTHISFTVYCTASKYRTPVHQTQYYIPAPQPPNKTLWCQIDTLVNSTSWIWYCLATAKNPLLVASSGWGADGSEDGLGGGDEEGKGRMVDGINHNGAVWCSSLFGLPPGSGAKLKPRKSDYGVPGDEMPSHQLMSAHLLLAVLCTVSPMLAGRPIC